MPPVLVRSPRSNPQGGKNEKYFCDRLIPVRSNIRAGTKTQPLDLKGRERAIQQIEMVYRSRPSFRGLATVCAEGLD